MPFPSPSRRRIVVGLILVVVLIGVGAGVYFLFFWQKLPKPGEPRYQEYVEVFDVGVAALDVGVEEMAGAKLTEATERVPEEPAAWANRGLLYLRKNQLDEAAADLQHAQKLAPESPEIENLLGQLAQKQGHYADAAAHYRKSLDHDPQDVRTRYSLVQVIRQESGPDSDAEAQKQLQEILRGQPNNLFVLQEVIALAAQRRDAAAVKDAVARLHTLAPAWSENTRRAFEALEKAAAGPLPGKVPSTLPGFVNLLPTEPGYVRSSEAVNPRGGNVGEPVRHFLRLQPLRPTPAAPDIELTFAAETLKPTPAVAGGRWEVVQVYWPTGAPEPAVLVANGREVRAATTEAPVLPFPGGPKAVPPTSCGVVPLDWNNDYRTDLLLAGAGGLRFFQQGADGGFIDVTDKTGLDRAVLDAAYYGAWAVDTDMDGDLDVIAAPVKGPPVVLRNNRDGTFKLLPSFAGVDGARAFTWADFDNDGAPDAAFLDAEGKLHVFANERMGQFSRRELPATLGKGLALAAADVNDDGVFDLLVLQATGGVVRLSDKDRGKSWDVAELVGGPALATHLEPGAATLLVGDLDNNGGLDLVASTPQSTQIWLLDTAGKFQALTAAPAPRVAALVELTKNGRLDLLALSEAGQPLRLANQTTKQYHWYSVRPHSTRKEEVKGDDRINSFGIGGEIEVRTGLVVQKQPIAAPVVHFGLGEQRSTSVARVLWPNGTFQVEFQQAGDQVVEAEQRLKGSCPFLFAYDGQEMQFVTDFMWSTPLGMYINAQDKGGFLQTEDWVKIRGEQLKPRDGAYDVRVLANLWETHYYDHMSLIVVDHPADTEVYVDERFAMTPMVPQVYVTGPPRPVARATDQDGRDVTEAVRAIDGNYLDTCGRGRFQGITRDHWVEVDLGDNAPTEGPLWLLATGWVHPTDSSINFAIEQGNHDRPHGLVLEVPDGNGGWKVGEPALGFPAGKNKTILIHLDGIGGAKSVARRFRLRTNMEIYWDALQYAPGLETGLARQTRLQPDTAELRFHGVVKMTNANPSSPELPHYEQLVGRGQYWRDLVGYYTRYGDVRELLQAVDDRYVIMNAGDEIAMRFPVPRGPAAGDKRDFVWVCDGWVKDGDLNTRFSKTVLPLPAHNLKSYDRPPRRLEDDPVYRRSPQDWETFHTRYVTPEVFEQGLRSFRRPAP